MREDRIENYFKKRVEETGGEVRKVVFPGRRHAPDRIALWPGQLWWVELKRPGAKPRAGQHREMDRLADAGQNVTWLSSKEQIDEFIRKVRNG